MVAIELTSGDVPFPLESPDPGDSAGRPSRPGLAVLPRFLLPALLGCLLASGCMTRGAPEPEPVTSADACHGLAEDACIAATNGDARRKGDLLSLKLASGKDKEYRSMPQACNEGIHEKCLEYRLWGYRPADGLYVVSMGFTEGGGYLVVDKATGSEARLDNDIPNFSPSGRRFVGVMSSEAHEPELDLAVWSLAAGAPRLEWSHRTVAGKYALYEFAGWQGEDRVRLKVTYGPTDGGPNKDGEATITRIDDGWALEKPDDCP